MVEPNWPGHPASLWGRVDSADQWLASPADLPDWSTPASLVENYALVPVWWQRALIPTLSCVGLVFVVAAVWGDWFGGRGAALHVFGIVLVIVVAVGCLAGLAGSTRSEMYWRKTRSDVAARAFEVVAAVDVPIWGIVADKVRLGDRASGDNTPDDLLFLMDLRVDHRILARQVAVLRAWLDAVAASDTGHDDLAAAFDRRESVRADFVFGESMCGVWIGRKPSVLPYEVLGLARVDPREAASFCSDDVLFVARPGRDLRRRSAIRRQE